MLNHFFLSRTESIADQDVPLWIKLIMLAGWHACWLTDYSADRATWWTTEFVDCSHHVCWITTFQWLMNDDCFCRGLASCDCVCGINLNGLPCCVLNLLTAIHLIVQMQWTNGECKRTESALEMTKFVVGRLNSQKGTELAVFDWLILVFVHVFACWNTPKSVSNLAKFRHRKKLYSKSPGSIMEPAIRLRTDISIQLWLRNILGASWFFFVVKCLTNWSWAQHPCTGPC